MNLTTARCVIRDFLADDACDLYETLSDDAVMEYIEPTFSMEETKAFIEDAGMCEPPLVYALVWRETGKVIGHVIFHPYEEGSCELGWIIHKAYWGKGIASEVTAGLLEYAKNLGAGSCVIECDPLQKASQHIALKYSFVYEGEDDGCSVYRRVF